MRARAPMFASIIAALFVGACGEDSGGSRGTQPPPEDELPATTSESDGTGTTASVDDESTSSTGGESESSSTGDASETTTSGTGSTG